MPTFAESGLDGFPPLVLFGLLAPTGTPPAVLAKVTAAENARLRSSDMQAAIAKLGMNPSLMSGGEFAKALGGQVGLWKAVVKEAGVHLE